LLNVQPWYGQRNDVVFPFSALQPVAAVGTAVGQDPDHAVLAAYHHHGFGRDALGHVVAWLGDFALVGHEHPALAEDALHLQAEHLRGGVHAAVHAVFPHQRVDVTGTQARELFGDDHGEDSPVSCTAGRTVAPTTRKAISTGAPIAGACSHAWVVVMTRRWPLVSSTSITG